MTCKAVQSLISAYLDEELSGRQMIALRRHLDDCPECAEELKCVESVKQLLGYEQIPAPSDGFEDRLVERVLAAGAAKDRARVGWIALTGVAAASMLGAALVLNALHGAQPAPPTSHSDEAMYRMVERDRAFSASTDPLVGSPVVPVTFGGR